MTALRFLARWLFARLTVFVDNFMIGAAWGVAIVITIRLTLYILKGSHLP